ncbi:MULTISPECIES: nitroreductase family deazaflavin-dependent oxidoreductase [Gordonia]|jgi:deazaflavin-dependent oxidoreductase (nitroreductase family)|uniref:Nitroreductase n=2 Tax=Gordonia alkanivorans TaxID=84096 RepID=W9DMB9_9ACTN|nr:MULTISPECIES: nitroreductase family deazaflavin-dependent oxidoreductase [Gordonia]AZZ82837.1 nitroreductase family deazaflavin-dependent oxidoreductase [Gordonia alkanivorans]ETA08856.1 hypothetical protein V525_01790 [Gordonia alkanivorans CGMCC 6845]MDH3005522.1 nitroreductase family deazaflavin-dependent oxidoreductase [Gordonia alkanivorans]MDH3010182.1 nitroreductase family deazaflavin-dependent oxidoreductase [Gordonia alkanivorans]MDH3014934.1 nitroreductase family deazaflavin-depen
MRLPDALARFNKIVTNPIQRMWAPHLPPFAMVEHVGRKSGKTYSIPVLAWVDRDKLTIVLTYGRHTDWVRNVQAAGSFAIVRKDKRYRVTGPRVVPSDSPDLAGGAKIFAMPFESALLGTLHKD